MPEPKGRKRRRGRERERRRTGTANASEGAVEAPGAEPARGRAAPPPPPNRAVIGPARHSPTARVTGLLLAIVTAFISAVLVYEALTGDASGIDQMARIVGGALMLVLALLVGTLVLFPTQLRDWFSRGR